MKMTQEELARLILRNEPLIQAIVNLSKDVDNSTLWAFWLTKRNGEEMVDVAQFPLYYKPTVAGIDFGQKCQTRDEVFKKLLNLIDV